MSSIFQCFLSLLALIQPPVAEKIPHDTEHFSQKSVDNYAWLREETNPKVIEYLEAENRYTEQETSDLKGLEETLYEEMKERTPQDDSSVPSKRGDYYYYARWEKDKSYPLYCRKKGSLSGPEEIYFDENSYAKGDFFTLASLDFSDDQNILAYCIDEVGSEIFTLKFKDLQSNTTLADTIYPVSGGAEFAMNNKVVFYLVSDSTQRPYRLYRHNLGSDFKSDILVYEEKDPKFLLSLSKSKDHKILFLKSKNNTTSTAFYLKSDDPEGTFVEILPKKTNVKYSVEHHDGKFLMLINDTSLNYRLISLNVDQKSPPKELIAARDDVPLEKIEVFEKYLALFQRKDGLPQVEIIDFSTGKSELLPFFEQTYSLSAGSNPEFNSTVLRIGYSSLTTPQTVYDCDMLNHKIEMKKREEVLNFNSADYVQERIFATSSDGVKIPISLVYKKNAPKKGWLLTGYGAYGMSYPSSFSSEHLSLLDRGVGYAIAHIRGGGEFGRKWYDGGRMFNKKNTFNDFIACSEHLIKEGYTTKEQLVIEGGSAGGLLMGAVMNMRPDLFRAVIAKVPFVDVINTMSDPSLPSTIAEYQEWGNPDIKEEYLYMVSYSPYDNVAAKDYPALLITAGLHDMRVRYWEPAKWTAKLRAVKSGSNPLYLKTHMKAGHFGSSGRYDSLREEAFIFAYILNLFK
jgi:oligopeptidase B